MSKDCYNAISNYSLFNFRLYKNGFSFSKFSLSKVSIAIFRKLSIPHSYACIHLSFDNWGEEKGRVVGFIYQAQTSINVVMKCYLLIVMDRVRMGLADNANMMIGMTWKFRT